MKRATLICLSLFLISGPMQNHQVNTKCHNIGAVAYLQLYWLKKAKKELFQTEQSITLQALDNSLHFVANGGLKSLLPFLNN